MNQTSNESLSFECYTKHLFGDSKYILRLDHENIFISPVRHQKINIDQKNSSSEPKYTIQISLANHLGWIILKNHQQIHLQGFWFNHNGKQKKIFSSHQHLIKLKSALASRIFFTDIKDQYLQFQFIGKGTTSKVYRCYSYLENKFVAVKYVPKILLLSVPNRSVIVFFPIQFQIQFFYEINILFRLRSHPSVLQILEIFEDQSNYYIVTELLEGYNLSQQFLMKPKGYNLKDSIILMKQILEALHHFRTHRVVHRDLNPTNLQFISKNSDELKIKVIDFGLAEFSNNPNLLFPQCGTPGYLAPEVIRFNEWNLTSYNEQVDIFSAGCVFFKIVLIDQVDRTYFKPKNKQFKIHNELLKIKGINMKMAEVLLRMLDLNPRTRISEIEALEMINTIQLNENQYSLTEGSIINLEKHENSNQFSIPSEIYQSLSLPMSMIKKIAFKSKLHQSQMILASQLPKSVNDLIRKFSAQELESIDHIISQTEKQFTLLFLIIFAIYISQLCPLQNNFLVTVYIHMYEFPLSRFSKNRKQNQRIQFLILIQKKIQNDQNQIPDYLFFFKLFLL